MQLYIRDQCNPVTSWSFDRAGVGHWSGFPSCLTPAVRVALLIRNCYCPILDPCLPSTIHTSTVVRLHRSFVPRDTDYLDTFTTPPPHTRCLAMIPAASCLESLGRELGPAPNVRGGDGAPGPGMVHGRGTRGALVGLGQYIPVLAANMAWSYAHVVQALCGEYM